MALQNKYNTQAAAQSMEYARTMNRINFEQQNQMFDKQTEWNSAKSQKERLQEAGLNPALMYGIGHGWSRRYYTCKKKVTQNGYFFMRRWLEEQH